jgi:TRAP-type C4-dicarboxylate transport system substrate-binding protein
MRFIAFQRRCCEDGAGDMPTIETGGFTMKMPGSAGAALAAAALISGLALAPAPTAAQEVTLRLHTFIPPVANPVKHFMMPWAEKVGKDSNGRIKVQVYPSMQLGGKSEQLLQQVRDGVADIVWTLPGFTPGVMPKLEIFELPFLHRTTHSTVMALQDYTEKYMKKDFEPYHVLLVNSHAGALFMTKDPINKVEDFKGMKLRSYSRTNAWILEALGSTPLQVALPELAPMLSKGTVTGSILPYEIAPSVKMQDLTDYFTTLAPPQPRLSTAIFTFLMNKQKYESLPADLKKVIDDNSGAKLAPFAIEVWDRIELDGEKVMRSKPKNKFVSLSAEETARFKQTVRPVFDRFKKLLDEGGDDGAKVLADVEALVEKYSK